MPRTSRNRIISLAAGTAASTGIGMIPLHRLPQPVRTAYVVLPAAAATGVVIAALRRVPSRPVDAVPEPGDVRRDARRRMTRVALPMAVGGLTAGAGATSIVVDRGIENWLRRRGVPAPRWAMGLASGALSLGIDVLTERSEGREGDEGSVSAEERAEPTSPPSA